MQASVGMVSRETCPQFGQISSEVVIMKIRLWIQTSLGSWA